MVISCFYLQESFPHLFMHTSKSMFVEISLRLSASLWKAVMKSHIRIDLFRQPLLDLVNDWGGACQAVAWGIVEGTW